MLTGGGGGKCMLYERGRTVVGVANKLTHAVDVRCGPYDAMRALHRRSSCCMQQSNLHNIHNLRS